MDGYGTRDGTRGGRATRRGVLAAAAGLVAGIVAKQAAERAPVAASGDTWSMPYTSGIQNTGRTLVTLDNDGDGQALYARSSGGQGVLGFSNANFGVIGGTYAPANSGLAGVYGYSAAPGTNGVIGYGFSGGTGVQGTNAQYGVVGQPAAASYNPANSIGVLGNNRSTGSGGIGVEGIVQGGGPATGTIGVYGVNLNAAANSHGIVGLSTHGHGLVGTCNAHASAGNTYAGLVGFAGVSDANAGNFYGNVAVGGNLIVTGSQTVFGAKSAALAHPDGSHRLVYCVEAPDSWLEDFGIGTLAGGKAEIKIDPEFAAVAEMGDYHVFITEGGDFHAHVTGKQASGFAVQQTTGTGAGMASGTFSWRVVAKRKDIKAARLAKLDLPKLTPPEIPPPHVPDLPTPPAPPARPEKP